MKIVITNAYARGSGGDMAILSSLIAEMRRIFDNPDITVATIDNSSNLQELFPGIRTVPSLITTIWDENASRLSKLISLINNWISADIWALMYRFGKDRPDRLLKKSEIESMNALADADLVVGVGGGYIRASAGIMHIIDLALTLRMLRLSRIMGKTTVLFSQSIGPFANVSQEKLAGHILKKMQFIITRESISRQLLKKMGVKDELVMESVDAAFLIRKQNPTVAQLPDEFAKIPKDYSGPLIGITARDWLAPQAQCRYERELALALDEISEKYDARILLIPQTTVERNEDDDRIVQKRIFEHMRQKNRTVLLNGSYDYKTLLGIYERLDFIIGTRFHSVIFSLTSKVPALVIAYEYKATGIMKDLGLSEWVIDIEKVNALKIAENFARLQNEKAAYLKQLESALPDYVAKAESSIEKINAIYLLNKKSDQPYAIEGHKAKA